MANRKITAMTALTAPATGDVLPIVDVSESAAADKNKKITVQELFKGVPDGTAAAPGLAFESDDGNGIYLAGTDTVGISTGGTQRVTVNASGDVSISGSLTVSGTTTTVESTTVTVDDKNIELGSVATPTDTTADGGGITLKGASDKTITWSNTTGYWTFNTGIEVGGHIQLDDSNELRLGTGQDLRIYHDGSHSYIDDQGTGNLILESNGGEIKLQTSNGGEDLARFVNNGAVELFHNGTKKVETTTDGLDITSTGALKLPVGTTAQRPSSPAQGDLRFSSTDTAAEIYNGTAWAAVGGGAGATGGGSDQWVVETDQTVTTSYELTAGKHGTTVSPTINSGATITVPSGAILVIL
tara:strand:+ start:512 stop:1579 length:1068 start_codon:yes stop_codon:yes gene_type:complete